MPGRRLRGFDRENMLRSPSRSAYIRTSVGAEAAPPPRDGLCSPIVSFDRTSTSAVEKLVGARGFEPPTPCTPCKCATSLRHAPT